MNRSPNCFILFSCLGSFIVWVEECCANNVLNNIMSHHFLNFQIPNSHIHQPTHVLSSTYSITISIFIKSLKTLHQTRCNYNMKNHKIIPSQQNQPLVDFLCPRLKYRAVELVFLSPITESDQSVYFAEMCLQNPL